MTPTFDLPIALSRWVPQPSLPAVKPRIVRDNLQMIATIKVGRSYTWEVPVIGEPITDKTWSRSDMDITENERITIEKEDYLTKFSIVKATRRVRLADIRCEALSEVADAYAVRFSILVHRIYAPEGEGHNLGTFFR